MKELKLYMCLLGCTPRGRNIEQHDVFFDIGQTLKHLVPAIIQFWPEAQGKIHIDAWREVTHVDGYSIQVVEKREPVENILPEKLFFINLGGYKENEFEEFHYKMLAVARDKGAAIQQAKQTAFYKHIGFKGAESHVDDRYGIDVDNMYEISDILSINVKEQYAIKLSKQPSSQKDELHLGYFKLDKL
jgi:hypothetical protein